MLLNEINPAAPDWLTAMTQTLHHRGPDDGGAVVFGMNGSPAVTRVLGRPDEAVEWKYVPAKLALGARRLAIVDLSPAGHQPMSSPDGRVWLVYNGELYNHVELRTELVARGMPFVGHSDTEVFLAAYRAWGTDCFARFDGMWGAAIIDWAAGRLLLSRDRFGIKPLYVTKFALGLAFSSEIKPLLLLPGAARGVNEARLRDFLYDGRVDHTDDTLFEGIWSAPPGCWIELDVRGRGTMHAGGAVRRYWRPAHVWRDDPDAPQRIRQELTDSIRAHLQGDAPIGSCLSGGIDSSSIVTILHALRSDGALNATPLTQHTFTASLPNSGVDEADFADAVVRACGDLRQHVVTPTPAGLLDAMPSLLYCQEQPFALPNVYMQWEIMRSARDAGLKVLLDGQGADEIFCGYEGYVPAYLAHLLGRFSLVTLLREWRAAKHLHFAQSSLLAGVMAAALPSKKRNAWRLRSNARKQPWLSQELLEAEQAAGMCSELEITPPDSIEVPKDAPAAMGRLWELFRHDSLPSLLRFEDRNSMAFSIESRVPFLSSGMVEYAMALPISRKIRNGVLKSPLRDAMRQRVPESILDRTDKLGFSVPIVDWMKGGLRTWWGDLLASRSFADRGCFEAKRLNSVKARLESGDTFAARSIWRMALTEEWARAFLDR